MDSKMRTIYVCGLTKFGSRIRESLSNVTGTRTKPEVTTAAVLSLIATKINTYLIMIMPHLKNTLKYLDVSF